MLQREAGNKMMAELILFTGSVPMELLQEAAQQWALDGGRQPRVVRHNGLGQLHAL